MSLGKSNQGFTLIESIIVPLLFVVIVRAALAGKGILDVRRNTSDILSSVQSVAEIAKTVTGGGSYGTGTLDTLLNTNRAFGNPRYKVSVTAGVATVTNQYDAAVTTTGATTNFTYSETGIPDDVCAGVVPRLQSLMWATVKIGAAAARATPASATQAATDCAALAGGTIVLTSRA